MNTAPICLFVYNRLEHTTKTVEALQNNLLAHESELFVYSDGAKNESGKTKVDNLRKYLRTISGFRKVSIIERTKNFGLSQSIITGVTEIVNQFGKVIVLEDDLVTSPYFIQYMNDSLNYYEEDNRVISIHSYTYPVKQNLPETFFLRGADCWGWATWKRGWQLFNSDGTKLLNELETNNLIKQFDFDGAYNFSGMLKRQIAGLNNSWAIRWYASAFIANKLTLYPGKSLIDNIGQDKSGTHASPKKVFNSNLSTKIINIGNIPVEENLQARRAIIEYFYSLRHGYLRKLISFFKKL